jgi:hypothetical protein
MGRHWNYLGITTEEFKKSIIIKPIFSKRKIE